jgi:NADPH:quinone reductase
VFVTGASGGVGTMMVSLAHAAGAVVWGQTGSEDKVAVITEMGAERVLVGDAEQIAPGVAELAPTVVLDSLGDGFMAPLVAAVEPRGRIVSLGTSAGPEVTFNMQQLYRNMLTLYGYGGMQLTRHERRPGLQAALRAVAAGELKVVIDAVLPLADVNEAFARLARREVRGKLLLDLS